MLCKCLFKLPGVFVFYFYSVKHNFNTSVLKMHIGKKKIDWDGISKGYLYCKCWPCFCICLQKVMQNIHKTYFWDLLLYVTKLVKETYFMNPRQGSPSPCEVCFRGWSSHGHYYRLNSTTHHRENLLLLLVCLNKIFLTPVCCQTWHWRQKHVSMQTGDSAEAGQECWVKTMTGPSGVIRW